MNIPVELIMDSQAFSQSCADHVQNIAAEIVIGSYHRYVEDLNPDVGATNFPSASSIRREMHNVCL